MNKLNGFRLTCMTAGMVIFAIGLLLVGLAITVGLIWWLVWSILDLANGNPASLANIAGIVIPVLALIGGGVSRR